MTYPPSPWHLNATACLSLWRVPVADLHGLQPGLRPLAAAGNTVVATAWIEYLPGGDLSYHELLAAVPISHGHKPAASVAEIWVDSEASLRAGREMWAVPKDLATFKYQHGTTCTATAATRDDWIATVAFRPRSAIPAISIPSVSFSVLQVADDLVSTPVHVAGSMRLAESSWNINPDGRLGYLAARRPLLSLCLSDVSVRFGA